LCHRAVEAVTTYEDEIEVRRPSVGTKVLILACAILAVLGSFWGIVWFIRAYVEPPRVMIPAPMALASRNSTPVPAPEPAPAATLAAITPAAIETPAAPPAQTAAPAMAASSSSSAPLVSEARAAPASRPAAQAPAAPAAAPREASQPSASDAVADRWAPINQFNAPPQAAPVPPPAQPAEQAAEPASAATASAPEKPEADADMVAESAVPAIEGPAPMPRRRPIMTASRRADPPLPRPRPEAAGGQPSVWIAVPSPDDRYQAGQ
jgi:cytoskeletal protein RodZ